jgi:arylsulfatase
LLLTVDTLRPDYLSHAGYDRQTSPTLDSLIQRGVWFSRAVTPVARTTPALASLLTGLHPHNHGLRRLFDARDPRAITLAEVARRNGYRTVAVVSNHVVTRARGLDAGFEVYDNTGDGRTAVDTTRDALAHLSELPRDRPVLLWTHYIDPHVPYRPPERYAREFDPGYTGRYPLFFGGEPGTVGNNAYPQDLPKAQAVFHNPLSAKVNAHIRRLYAADIRQTDDAIGTLLDGIRHQYGDDWVIVFTADHGESLGEHDYFYDHGDYVYESGIRVPLAFVDLRAEREAATNIDTWASLIDVVPTVAEWLGWQWPEAIDGRSLMPAIRGEPLAEGPVFAESGKSFFETEVRRRVTFDIRGRFRSVTMGSMKLIHTPGATDPWELYNLDDDPGETIDLWAELAGTSDARALVAALQRWMAGDLMAEPPTAASRNDVEALKSLGYMDDE